MKTNISILKLDLREITYSKKTIILSFGIVTFFISMGDAIMSYISPIIIENSLNNSFQMGLVISTSSMAGILTDFIAGEWFKFKTFKFFMFWGFILSLFFPIIFLLFPDHVIIFILGMIVWGIYFELVKFANFNFIKVFSSKSDHALAWGILNTLTSIAYTFAPILASRLLTKGTDFVLFGAAIFFSLAIFSLIVILGSDKNKNIKFENFKNEGLMHEVKVWRLLSKKVWYLLYFAFTITFIDSAFWSIGALLSDKENDGGLIFIAYGLPSLFMGLIAARLAKYFGKKKLAFLGGSISGTFLFFAGLADSIDLFILLVFISSLFTSLSLVEVLATFEDYIARLGINSNHMIGLQSSFISFAFVLGPIISGFLAHFVELKQAFSLIGIFFLITSLCLYAITPRKIKMPQEKLHKLEMGK